MMPGSAGTVSIGYRLVAIASSAGGLSALIELLSRLPADFPLPVLIVQHVDRNHESFLSGILSRRTKLHVKNAVDRERPMPCRVYVAPSDVHLTVDQDGALRLSHDAPVRFVRPSADVLFESAASHAGGPIIGVVLTGTGSDGADGARAIKHNGGTVIAQDEASSEFFGMPQAAIDTGSVDFVLPLGEIAEYLMMLTHREAA